MKGNLKRVKSFLFSLILLGFLYDSVVFAQCPIPEEVAKGLSHFPARGVQIIAVRPTAYPEICEVHIRLQNRDQILYVGAKGDFFLMGQLYDASSGNNLTRSAIEAATQFSAAEMQQLKELTAFSIGNSGKTLLL